MALYPSAPATQESVTTSGGNFASVYASAVKTANNLVEKKIAAMEKEKAQ